MLKIHFWDFYKWSVGNLESFHSKVSWYFLYKDQLTPPLGTIMSEIKIDKSNTGEEVCMLC